MSPSSSLIFHDAPEHGSETSADAVDLPKFTSLPRGASSSALTAEIDAIGRKNSMPSSIPTSRKSPAMIRSPARGQRSSTALPPGPGRTSTTSPQGKSAEDVMSSTSSTSSLPATPYAFSVDPSTGQIIPLSASEVEQSSGGMQHYPNQPPPFFLKGGTPIQTPSDVPTVGVNYFPGISAGSNNSDKSSGGSVAGSVVSNPVKDSGAGGGYHAYNERVCLNDL